MGMIRQTARHRHNATFVLYRRITGMVSSNTCLNALCLLRLDRISQTHPTWSKTVFVSEEAARIENGRSSACEGTSAQKVGLSITPVHQKSGRDDCCLAPACCPVLAGHAQWDLFVCFARSCWTCRWKPRCKRLRETKDMQGDTCTFKFVS